MPGTSVTITSSQTWTAPANCSRIDVTIIARGGRGGDHDPVQETGGAGGGQGGSWQMASYPCPGGTQVGCSLSDALAQIEIGVNALRAASGADSFGSSPGSGGSTSKSGFGGYSTPTNGQNGYGPSGNNGGNGGGSGGQGGTPSQPATGGSYGGGGGGQGFNGPGSGASGGPCVIMITYYPLNNQ